MSEAEDWAVIVRAKNQEIQKWQQQALELSNLVAPLRDEVARLRGVLEEIADGPGTSGYATPYEKWMIETAQAALTPQAVKGG